MTDETPRHWYIHLAIVVVIVGLLMFSVGSVAMSSEMQQDTEAFGEYCDDRGGEVVNVQSVAHGGLHCQLDDGEAVHMSDVDLSPYKDGQQEVSD